MKLKCTNKKNKEKNNNNNKIKIGGVPLRVTVFEGGQALV